MTCICSIQVCATTVEDRRARHKSDLVLEAMFPRVIPDDPNVESMLEFVCVFC
jgi:hypothetical protein